MSNNSQLALLGGPKTIKKPLKRFNTIGDKEIRAMGLDPDEIRIKMDQILDWNASSVKEMSAEDVETDKTLVKSKLDKNEGK